jgi:vacuolar-type H+-ATPase subunit F/Vma7
MSVSVIGPSSFIICFELIGAVGFEAEDGAQAAKVLAGLMEEGKFKFIILPEIFAKDTLEIREEVMNEEKIWPVFAFIPDLMGKKGMRLEELKSIISLAIGAKLEL